MLTRTGCTNYDRCGQPAVWTAADLLQKAFSSGSGLGVSADDINVDSLIQPVPKNLADNSEPPERSLVEFTFLTSPVVSIVLFGDPSHSANAPYNHGSAEGSGVSHLGPQYPFIPPPC